MLGGPGFAWPSLAHSERKIANLFNHLNHISGSSPVGGSPISKSWVGHGPLALPALHEYMHRHKCVKLN